MGTEFRDRLSAAVFDANDRGQFAADAVLALLPPPDVLSWVSAHPEAAKGLVEGTMVAVPSVHTNSPEEPSEYDLQRLGNLAADTRDRGGTSSTVRRLLAFYRLQAAEIVRLKAMLAASTPVPSDEAQGGR